MGFNPFCKPREIAEIKIAVGEPERRAGRASETSSQPAMGEGRFGLQFLVALQTRIDWQQSDNLSNDRK